MVDKLREPIDSADGRMNKCPAPNRPTTPIITLREAVRNISEVAELVAWAIARNARQSLFGQKNPVEKDTPKSADGRW